MGLVDRLLDRWRQVPPLVTDVAVAAVVALVTITSIVTTDRGDPGEHTTAWGWVLQALQLVPLVWRRRAPVTVLVLVSAGAFAYGAANLADPAVVFAPAVAVYTVAVHRARSVSVPCAVALTLVAGIVLAIDTRADAEDVAVNYFIGITSWVVGDTTRTQRERAVWLAGRQEDESRRAAADERVRIARDLHDIVAHHISVVVVQAEAAQEVLATRPDRAESAMAAVADTARTALGELRRTLGVLRTDPELAPQPGLAAVDDLAASVRQAGLSVDVRTTGAPRSVDGVVGVTAYRVVQEALTNVLRHAHATRAQVGLDFDDGALVVSVTMWTVVPVGPLRTPSSRIVIGAAPGTGTDA